jgi:ribosomal protein L27
VRSPPRRSRARWRTGLAKDDTIFAKRSGKVEFRESGERRFVSVAE